MLKLICLVLCVAVSLNNVSAFGTKAFRNYIAGYIDPCIKEVGAGEAEVKALEQDNNIGAFDPCFFRCILKKIDILDAKGLFNVEKARVAIKAYVKKPEAVVDLEKIAEACSSVNDQAVSGDVYCERSKLLQECGIKLDVNSKIPNE